MSRICKGNWFCDFSTPNLLRGVLSFNARSLCKGTYFVWNKLSRRPKWLLARGDSVPHSRSFCLDGGNCSPFCSENPLTPQMWNFRSDVRKWVWWCISLGAMPQLCWNCGLSVIIKFLVNYSMWWHVNCIRCGPCGRSKKLYDGELSHWGSRVASFHKFSSQRRCISLKTH